MTRRSAIMWFCSLVALLLAGCPSSDNGAGINHPPYPILMGWKAAGAGETTGTETTMPNWTALQMNSTVYYQLKIDEVDGKKDPDGDQVFFRSDTIDTPGVSLDADTGLVTATTAAKGRSEPISFWTEDSHGADTSAAKYTVSFNFGS